MPSKNAETNSGEWLVESGGPMLALGAAFPDLVERLVAGDLRVVGLVGALVVLVGILVWRRPRGGRALDIEVEELKELPRVLSSVKKLRRASRVSRRSIARWEKEYAEKRKLRSLSDVALFEMGVDVLSGLVASNLKGTRFTPSLDDETQMHESLTYLLEETKLRAIGLQEMVEKRNGQIRKSALKLSGLKTGKRARARRRAHAAGVSRRASPVTSAGKRPLGARKTGRRAT